VIEGRWEQILQADNRASSAL